MCKACNPSDDESNSKNLFHDVPLRKSFRAGLVLPADMPIVSLPIHDSSIYLDQKEKIVTLEYPILPMVKDIIKYLIAPQYRAKELHYELFLSQCGEKMVESRRYE